MMSVTHLPTIQRGSCAIGGICHKRAIGRVQHKRWRKVGRSDVQRQRHHEEDVEE